VDSYKHILKTAPHEGISKIYTYLMQYIGLVRYSARKVSCWLSEWIILLFPITCIFFMNSFPVWVILKRNIMILSTENNFCIWGNAH